MFLSIILIVLVLLLILYLIYFKKDEVYYIDNFLTNEEYNYIKNYTRSIKNLKSEKFRLIKPILENKINNIFYSEKYINKIKEIINEDIKKSDFPIEFRVYPTGSEGMKCHKDTLLYEKPQYEMVYTIENESDSYTNWYSYLGWNNIIYTKPNSLIIVKAQENIHCVSPINNGYRTILKLIYTQTEKYNENYLKEIKRF
jgi:hypothetical protein